MDLSFFEGRDKKIKALEASDDAAGLESPKGDLKSFLFFILAYAVLLLIFCNFVSSVPIGNYWWDYLALKGIEVQMFAGSANIRELWLPFMLPIWLLKASNLISGYGVDYFVAHVLIGAATFALTYQPVFSRLPKRFAVCIYLLLLVFSVVPVALYFTFFSFADANAVAYHGFYNRYMDVIYCFLVLSFWVKKEKESFSVAVFWSFALVVALLTKLSYFVVFLALLWANVLSERSRPALVSCIVGAGAAAGLYLLWPNYFETVWNIVLVRGLAPLLKWEVLAALAGVAGVLLSVCFYLMKKEIRIFLFASLPLLSSIALSSGNVGDLQPLRLAFALALPVFVYRSELRSSKLILERERSAKKSIRWGMSLYFSALLVISLMMVRPVLVVMKTAMITGTAIFAHEAGLRSEFVEFRNIKGFFSHAYYLPQSLRHLLDMREFSVSEYGSNGWHKAGFFILYAREMDKTLSYVSQFRNDKISWFSFPGLVPQIYGVGRIPEGAWPWYLYGHEISRSYHPDFLAINAESRVAVVDECYWSGKELLENFGDEIRIKSRIIFKSACFTVYGD